MNGVLAHCRFEEYVGIIKLCNKYTYIYFSFQMFHSLESSYVSVVTIAQQILRLHRRNCKFSLKRKRYFR